MLVLSRKTGESFVIGDDITVTVQSIKGDLVRISIDAPKSIPILRGELKAATEANREAAEVKLDAVAKLKEQLEKK